MLVQKFKDEVKEQFLNVVLADLESCKTEADCIGW